MARLFIASGIFHPESGGPATYLHQLLPALQARGWDVRAQTYGDGPTDGYPYPLTRIPRRVLPVRLAHYALAAWNAVHWADLIYLHTLDLPLPGAGGPPRVMKIVGDVAWERCIRKGWIPPTEDIDVFQARAYGGLADQQKRSRARQVQTMDAVIVPSQYLKRLVVGWGVPAARVHVIYNALPSLPADARLTPSEARARLGLDARPTLFTAARLTAWKGVDHLIAALKQVPDVRLIVAGDGDQLLRLRTLAADLGDERVRLLGRVARPVVYQYMQAADYFVLYSGYEGLPHTVLESLRLGTPVIASDKGGNPEVVAHDVNGLLVPYVDHAALAETLRTAFAGDTRDRLAANAHIDPTRFNFAQMIAQTHAILTSHLV